MNTKALLYRAWGWQQSNTPGGIWNSCLVQGHFRIVLWEATFHFGIHRPFTNFSSEGKEQRTGSERSVKMLVCDSVVQGQTANLMLCSCALCFFCSHTIVFSAVFTCPVSWGQMWWKGKKNCHITEKVFTQPLCLEGHLLIKCVILYSA